MRRIRAICIVAAVLALLGGCMLNMSDVVVIVYNGTEYTAADTVDFGQLSLGAGPDYSWDCEIRNVSAEMVTLNALQAGGDFGKDFTRGLPYHIPDGETVPFALTMTASRTGTWTGTLTIGASDALGEASFQLQAETAP